MGSQREGYWCCLVTRDGAETVGRTLESIISQSHPPAFVVVVDDGSTDGTSGILREMSGTAPMLFMVKTSSANRDIRRVPILLNLGIAEARRARAGSPLPTYMMVSGDDNLLTQSYSAEIMKGMDADSKIAVASGTWLGSAGRSDQMPHGAGRFVRMNYIDSVGGKFPVAYGWEVWLLYKALQSGYAVRIFPDVRYEHLRPYNPKNLTGWGRAMFSLGFPTVFVLLRFGLSFVWTGRGTQSRKGSITMLAGYLSAKVNPDSLKPNLIADEGLKAFIRRFSLARLTRIPWKLDVSE